MGFRSSYSPEVQATLERLTEATVKAIKREHDRGKTKERLSIEYNMSIECIDAVLLEF